MKVLVIRHLHGNLSTQGAMYVDGKFFAYTLEDKVQKDGVKIYGETAISAGIYRVKSSYSARFKRYLPEILEVPKFSGIRIHGGNNAKDTLGCILIGKKRFEGGICECKDVVNQLSNKLASVQQKGEFSSILIVDDYKDVEMYKQFIPDSMVNGLWVYP